MDGWNTSFLLGWPIFSDYVSFREGTQFIWRFFHKPRIPDPEQKTPGFFMEKDPSFFFVGSTECLAPRIQVFPEGRIGTKKSILFDREVFGFLG